MLCHHWPKKSKPTCPTAPCQSPRFTLTTITVWDHISSCGVRPTATRTSRVIASKRTIRTGCGWISRTAIPSLHIDRPFSATSPSWKIVAMPIPIAPAQSLNEHHHHHHPSTLRIRATIDNAVDASKTTHTISPRFEPLQWSTFFNTFLPLYCKKPSARLA